MDTALQTQAWQTAVLLIGRLVMAGMFAMGVTFKFMDIGGTAGYIASVGFPMATLLAWAAAFFELALVIAFLTGLYFREAALLAAVYVVFLGFAFHGPSHWTDAEGLNFGAFISHFPFGAGLLFAAVAGPGRLLTLRRGVLA
ncbi:MAG: DoxX family protein [Pseudorhodobacter sp.]|nr:DoxX family protein [Pseudorhodobacter sp.]